MKDQKDDYVDETFRKVEAYLLTLPNQDTKQIVLGEDVYSPAGLLKEVRDRAPKGIKFALALGEEMD